MPLPSVHFLADNVVQKQEDVDISCQSQKGKKLSSLKRKTCTMIICTITAFLRNR